MRNGGLRNCKNIFKNVMTRNPYSQLAGGTYCDEKNDWWHIFVTSKPTSEMCSVIVKELYLTLFHMSPFLAK